jgi:hypothetical protein
MGMSDNGEWAGAQIYLLHFLVFLLSNPCCSVTSSPLAMSLVIADQLREAREQRGLSIEDAAHETRIPAVRLRQMEDGNFAAFGNMAYARGFIVNYSNYLKVNTETFVGSLPRPILGGAADYRYLTTSLGPWVQTAVRHRLKGSSRDSSTGAFENQGLHALLIFLGIATCTAILGVEFFSSKGLGSINQSPMSSMSSPLTKKPMAVATPRSTSIKVETPFAKVETPLVKPLSKPITFAAPRIAIPHTKSVAVTKVPAVLPKEPTLVAATSSPAVATPEQPKEEVRVPDISTLPVKRAEPVEEHDTNPPSPGL